MFLENVTFYVFETFIRGNVSNGLFMVLNFLPFPLFYVLEYLKTMMILSIGEEKKLRISDFISNQPFSSFFHGFFAYTLQLSTFGFCCSFTIGLLDMGVLNKAVYTAVNAMCSLIYYPLDTIRKYQIVHKNVNFMNAIYALGFKGLYKGCTYHLIRILIELMLTEYFEILRKHIFPEDNTSDTNSDFDDLMIDADDLD